jgi:hypothetical protein
MALVYYFVDLISDRPSLPLLLFIGDWRISRIYWILLPHGRSRIMHWRGHD